jgi:hypothetical protein
MGTEKGCNSKGYSLFGILGNLLMRNLQIHGKMIINMLIL